MLDEWQSGHKEGYLTKVIKVGNCTATVHRPILDEKEKSRREEQVRNALRGLMMKGI